MANPVEIIDRNNRQIHHYPSEAAACRDLFGGDKSTQKYINMAVQVKGIGVIHGLEERYIARRMTAEEFEQGLPKRIRAKKNN